ncbi:MAG: MotA/TolQ/ExbB proton channel family protein [Polyangiaceae bacterium]|jgi:biopolymer transport protein ExbB|nr:MotA/TolQ/ExbB proton channel family protein [Polyangiaceae bacterium]MBK8940092.1 MotA/TolQ/ExbB proton channel family protein [Polyangiaceae bacterium]
MNLVEWLKRVMVSTGAAWVMWLMIGLSVGSVAIILERAWFFNSMKDDLGRLSRDLQNALANSLDAAKKRMAQSPSAEAAVVSAGLAVAHMGPDAAEEAMAGATSLQRMKLEKRLAFLATLGNNAPFIGLFGTVIGVVMAFDQLEVAAKEAASSAQQMAPDEVMGAIGEALVATAVGIGVAIPAVAANNLFQRIVKATLANTDALSRLVMVHLRGSEALSMAGGAPGAVEPEAPPAEPVEKLKTKKKSSTSSKRADDEPSKTTDRGED